MVNQSAMMDLKLDCLPLHKFYKIKILATTLQNTLHIATKLNPEIALLRNK